MRTLNHSFEFGFWVVSYEWFLFTLEYAVGVKGEVVCVVVRKIPSKLCTQKTRLRKISHYKSRRYSLPQSFWLIKKSSHSEYKKGGTKNSGRLLLFVSLIKSYYCFCLTPKVFSIGNTICSMLNNFTITTKTMNFTTKSRLLSKLSTFVYSPTL